MKRTNKKMGKKNQSNKAGTIFFILAVVSLIFLLFYYFGVKPEMDKSLNDYCKINFGQAYAFESAAPSLHLGNCFTVTQNNYLVRKYFYFSDYYSWQRNITGVKK